MTRDGKGRFVKGNPGGPGRKSIASEQEYRDTVFEVVPLERWRRMIEKQAARAEKGDIRAFEVLAKYIAPIITKNEITGENGGPIQIVNLGIDTDKL